MDVGCKGDDRGDKDDQAFQAVHVNAEVAFEHLIAGGGRRLDAIGSSRLADHGSEAHVL